MANYINNIASLRLRKGTVNTMIEVLGYSTDKDGGQGLFYWDPTSVEADNGGTIFQVTGEATGRWKRVFDSSYINMGWFGLDKTGTTAVTTQYNIAKALIPASGGTIEFPAGTFLCNNESWRIYRNNLTLKGAGMDKTILETPLTATEGIAFAPYRSSGWLLNEASVYTYEDVAAVGQRYLDVKVGNSAITLTPGTAVFINAGASQYDQQFGQFNIVESVVGQRINFKYALGRDYTSAKSSWRGTLTADFTIPAVGATAVAVMDIAPIVQTVIISLGNESFFIQAVSGNNVTLKNMGKGTGTGVIPAGTRVFKGRVIIPTPSTALNNTVQDLTIRGNRKAVVFSNSINTRCKNVHFFRKSDLAGVGGWIDGDDGLDLILDTCKAASAELKNGQFARSFGEVKIINSQFFNCTTEISEFNYDFKIDKCDFHVGYLVAGDEVNNIINVGTTTSNVSITNCNFFGDGINSFINASDVQTYNNGSAGKVLIEGNTFFGNNMSNGIDIFRPGTTVINNNTIQGRINRIFGSSGALSYGTTNQVDQNERFGFGQACIITNNRFDGYTDQFINRGPTNLVVKDNDINRFGPYGETPSADSSNGNIIRNGTVSTNSYERVVFKDNTFRNWYYMPNSLTISGPRSVRWDVSNNLFVNTNSPFRTGDFIFNNFSPDTTLYGSINYIPQLKNKDADWAAYMDFVNQASGTLTTNEITAGKQFLTDIYNNNLRDKLDYILLYLGDTNASKVPLLGWEKVSYKSFDNKGLTFGANGYAGDGVDDYGVIAETANFDTTNFGLFVQITNPNTASVASNYIGRYNGSANSALRISQSSTNILTGIGGVSIVPSSYSPSNGFIYTGVAGSSALNLIDTTNHKVSNTTLGTVQTVINSSIVTHAQINPTGTVNAFNNATLGAVGITKLLTLAEAQALRVIIYNFLIALGRPVQTTTLTPILSQGNRNIIQYYRPDITTDQSNSDLNTLYPLAPVGTSVIAKNTVGGGVIYTKDDTSGSWIRSAILTP